MYTILVVDDDPLIRKLIARLLTLDGYVVELAANGQEAIDKINYFPVDMVITDLVMQVMDGYTLINYLKKIYPHIPIIVVSGENHEATSLQVDRVIAKPFSPNNLRKEVETLLKSE